MRKGHFCFHRFHLIFHSELFLIIRHAGPTIQILDKSGQNWAWLGMPGNTQPKTEVSDTKFPL